MDSTTTGYRDRRSPSSDQFLSFFSFSPPSSSTITTTDELVEAEIFWTEDFTEPNHNKGQNQNHNHSDLTIPKSFTSHYNQKNNRRLSFGFTHSLNSGILTVLPESDKGSQDLCRNTSITSTSSQLIPMIPRPAHCQSSEYSQSVLSRKFQQSAPMNVPVLSQAMAKRSNGDLFDVIDGKDDGNYEILPPHELVARGSGVSPKTTFSVLDGVGRTLKGRDLRQNYQENYAMDIKSKASSSYRYKKVKSKQENPIDLQQLATGKLFGLQVIFILPTIIKPLV